MPVLRSSMVRILTLVVCFVVAAVHAPAQRYKLPAYSVVPPGGWTTTTQKVAKGGVAFLGPREQNFAVNINILSEPAPYETLQQYVEGTHRQIASHKEAGMTILKDGSTVVAATPAHTVVAAMHIPNRPEIPLLSTHQVYVMHNNRAYILTLTYPKGTPAASAKQYVAAFNKLVASFHWEKEPAPKK